MAGGGHLSNTADTTLFGSAPRVYRLNSIQFSLGAPTFVIHLNNIDMQGGYTGAYPQAGILNFSGQTQIVQVDAASVGQQNEVVFGNGVRLESILFQNSDLTIFSSAASAGNSTIQNFRTLNFEVQSTAGSSTIGNIGGATTFRDSTSAGSASIHNFGASTSQAAGGTSFEEFAIAGDASIVNDGSAIADSGARTTFVGGASARGARIANNAGLVEGGSTRFYGSGSGGAGGASITNNGAGLLGDPGRTYFYNDASAQDATVINNGGSAPVGHGGESIFASRSDASNATLIANAGAPGANPVLSPDGLGGRILFNESSSGGTSRVIVRGNGNVDISGHAAPGVTIGSLEGDGQAFLGSNNLSVGSSNTSTTFAGSARNGGDQGGNGGSLTKVGAGTWTLSGNNTYSGATTVSAGKLLVDGSIAASSAVAVNAGATLGGHGVVSTLSGAGTITPGNSAGILTATSIDPSAGTDFVFDLSRVGSPLYSNTAASGNDVLHLTGASPFAAAFTSANQLTFDFSGASLADNQLYRGGFFTDSLVNLSLIDTASFVYLGLNGFSVRFDGFVTEPMADFASGTITNGRLMQFGIQAGQVQVREPPAIALLALGVIVLLGRTLFVGQRVGVRARALP